MSRVAAALAAALATGVLALYAQLMRDQGDAPALWVVALFAAGIGACCVGAVLPRSWATLVALVILGLLTLLSLPSIGMFLLPSVLLLVLACTGTRIAGHANQY